jgi:hypothetical protein
MSAFAQASCEVGTSVWNFGVSRPRFARMPVLSPVPFSSYVQWFEAVADLSKPF